MESKPIKLSPKKGGHGHVTSYTVNLGSAEVRACGFLDADNQPLALEKIIDIDKKQIIIKLAGE